MLRYSELHRQRFNIGTRMGEADRKMPAMPNVFFGNDGKVSRYNMRKFGELPFHLINSGRIKDLCDYVLFNYHWLHAKISAVPLDKIIEDFYSTLSIVDSVDLQRQVRTTFKNKAANAGHAGHFGQRLLIKKLHTKLLVDSAAVRGSRVQTCQ